MTLPDWLMNNTGLKLLSVLGAILLWLFVSLNHEATKSLRIPVETRNLPRNLRINGVLPVAVEVTVAGPKFRIIMLDQHELHLYLDLEDAREGTVAFPSLSRAMRVPAGISVIRIQPASLELLLERNAGT